MMRVVMIEDVTLPMRGRGAKTHYHGGRTYEVEEAFGEDLCLQKKARRFDEPEEDPGVEQELAANSRRLRLEKARQESEAVQLDAEEKHRAQSEAVKSKRAAVLAEFEEARLEDLSETDQECVKWLEQL